MGHLSSSILRFYSLIRLDSSIKHVKTVLNVDFTFESCLLNRALLFRSGFACNEIYQKIATRYRVVEARKFDKVRIEGIEYY